MAWFNFAAWFLLSSAGVSAWAPAHVHPANLALTRLASSRKGAGVSRREVLQFGALLAPIISIPSIAGALGGTEPLELERCIYLILRVQEATQQAST